MTRRSAPAFAWGVRRRFGRVSAHVNCGLGGAGWGVAGARETGYYSAAFKIVEVLTTVPWILASSGLPILARAARDDSARLSYAVQRLFEVGLILGVWVSASTIVGARLGIEVVAGAKFHPSIGVLEIQALAVVTSFIAAILGYALLSLRQYRELLRANFLAVAIVTVLALALIPSHGARGAAVAPTVGEACLGLAYAVSLARGRAHLRLSLRVLPRLALALAASLAVAYALPVSSELIRLLALAAVYFPLLYVLDAIPPEMVAAIVHRLR